MAFQWDKFYEWRRHPLLSNNMRHSLPGFGLGLSAFAAYVAYDMFTAAKKKDSAV